MLLSLISYLFPRIHFHLGSKLCVHSNKRTDVLPLRKLRWFSSIWLTWWIQTWLTPGLVEWRVYLSRLPLDDLEVSVNLQGSSAFSSRPNQLTWSEGVWKGKRGADKKLKDKGRLLHFNRNLTSLIKMNEIYTRWIWNVFIIELFKSALSKVVDFTLLVVFFNFLESHSDDAPWCCSWRGSQE